MALNRNISISCIDGGRNETSDLHTNQLMVEKIAEIKQNLLFELVWQCEQ